jgi:8-oxo-dGTP pyrophosphatase MutT (NUDIX family)
MATVGRFLAGIGALIWDPAEDKYLLLKRSSQKDFAAGLWECVTGRVDQGEGFEDALFREVREETGLKVHPFYILGTTHFYRGESRPEHELVGVIYCCTIVKQERSDYQIRLTSEHSEYRWVTAEQVFEFLSVEDPTERWLSSVIEKAEKIKGLLPAELVVLNKGEGFEIDTFVKPK